MTRRRKRALLAAAVVGALLPLLTWSPGPGPGSAPGRSTGSATPSPTAEPSAEATAAPAAAPPAAPAAAPRPPTLSSELAEPPARIPTDRVGVDTASDPESAADRLAGVLDDVVPPVGTSTFVVVPGSGPAPGPGPVRAVRVEVEGGLSVAPEAFAGFVMDTLNDPRGWRREGATFARTDGEAEIVVVLASPKTSEELCRPLVTLGEVSCRAGAKAVITYSRWVRGQPDYGRDRSGYRQYVINHEVGHVLGRVHESCPGPGLPAPVMQQQTLGLAGCAPNPWPYP